MKRFRCSLEEKRKRQLAFRSGALATFSTSKKALAGRKKSLCEYLQSSMKHVAEAVACCRK